MTKYLMSLATIALLASACAVKSERTVVERPVVAPAATATTVYTPPPPTTTVVVPTR